MTETHELNRPVICLRYAARGVGIRGAASDYRFRRHTSSHRDEQADKEGTTAIVKKYRNRLNKKRGLDRLSYQGVYQCLEPGAKDAEIRGGWQSTG